MHVILDIFFSTPITTVVACVLGLLIFLKYRVICEVIGGQTYKRVVSRIKFFKDSKFSFLLIIISSVVVLNILFYKFGYGIKLYVAGLFAYSMLLLAAIDFKTQMLPDIITKPLIMLGILQGCFELFVDLESSIIGALAGYFILWSVNFGFRMIRGIDGMGYGDFKLLSAICAWTGIKMLPFVILLSSIIGVLVALTIIKLTKSDINTPTPFGPSLVFTGFIAFLYGDDVINWYLAALLRN